ncbi:MAG TPA: NADH-quinone oxidoreductase subunit J [bacterium]|nr:NADH-quinone oxidoreductase subunit J [bacterium]
MEFIVFVIAAAGALAGGIGVVASHPPVRSALSLLLVLGSLAIMYLLLAAQFIAALQVIVYAGAIVVLFLFVIMLLHTRPGEGRIDKLRWQRPVSYVLSGVFLCALLWAIWTGTGTQVAMPPAGFGTADSVGRSLFTTFLLPFEIASVVLLVGIIAAVVVGRPSVTPSTRADLPPP